MTLPNQALISLQNDLEDPVLLRKRVVSLRKNLTASGVRATPEIRDDVPMSDLALEEKSDPATLYTLAITFLTSGAAVAVVNALRATFEAAHSANLKATVTIGACSLEVSGEHLSGQEAQKLEDTLDLWIRTKDARGAAS